jgi:HK97 family phage prohead protease
MISVERGDVAGASFAFMVPEARGQRWDFNAKPVIRELLDVDLMDVTVCANPAYEDTSVALRTLRSETMPLLGRTLARYLVDAL